MSDYDPYKQDPNRVDPNRDPNRVDPDPRDIRFDRSGGYSWNWILGGIAAAVLVLIGLSLMTGNDRSAQGVAPAETTGQAEPANPAPAQRNPPPPVTPDQ